MMKSKPVLTIALCTLFAQGSVNVSAQGQLNRLKNRVQNAAENKIDRAANKAIDKAVDHAFTEPASAPPEKNTPKTTNAEAPQSGTLPDDERGAAPEKLYKHYSFIPGENVLYQEDFATASLGELPGRWNANSGGNIVTLAGEDNKWLNLIHGIYLSGVNQKALGESYTLEFDLLLKATPQTGYYLPSFQFGAFASGAEPANDNKFLSGYKTNNAFEINIEPGSSLSSKIQLRSFAAKNETFRSDRLENKILNQKLNKKMHIALAVNKSRIQLWVDQHKLLDLPRAINHQAAAINQLFFKTENSGGYHEGNFSYLITNIKVASGINNIKSEFLASGRLSTSGIVFTTNSDKLLPYSYGIIEQMATLLSESPDLKIRIVGHTDSDGSSQANTALSLRRADAVKAALANVYNIQPGRIQTAGKGATEPLKPNSTAEGKAANRRVEFLAATTN